jgi:phenylpyruvate tautomerase PptA (4-oxalocrotonate tautomerase family)
MMPIVDVELVVERSLTESSELSRALADALGAVLGSPQGQTWVRLRTLAKEGYAENGTTLNSEQLPVFVTVLLAHPPKGQKLKTQIGAVTNAVANCTKTPSHLVHVEYAPDAASRQALGGKLIE